MSCSLIVPEMFQNTQVYVKYFEMFQNTLVYVKCFEMFQNTLVYVKCLDWNYITV
jgi:hypothetical protein